MHAHADPGQAALHARGTGELLRTIACNEQMVETPAVAPAISSSGDATYVPRCWQLPLARLHLGRH